MTATAFNSVYDQYFLMALPFLASCAGVVVGDAARISRRGIAAVSAAVLVAAVEAPRLAEVVVHRLHETAREADLVAEIRRHPGRTLLTAEPGFAIVANKRLPREYDACDPYAAHLAGRFNAYVERALPQSDLILIGDRMIEYLDPETTARVVRSGKPLVFATAADRSAWEAKAGQARDDPARR